MTEAERRACTVIWKTPAYLERKPSERKYRLFAAAYCRQLLAVEPAFMGPSGDDLPC